MYAREINQLIAQLTPTQKEKLRELIILNRAIAWLQNKPVFSPRRLKYVLDLLDGVKPKPLSHHSCRNGKVRIIKEVANV